MSILSPSVPAKLMTRALGGRVNGALLRRWVCDGSLWSGKYIPEGQRGKERLFPLVSVYEAALLPMFRYGKHRVVAQAFAKYAESMKAPEDWPWIGIPGYWAFSIEGRGRKQNPHIGWFVHGDCLGQLGSRDKAGEIGEDLHVVIPIGNITSRINMRLRELGWEGVARTRASGATAPGSVRIWG